MQIGSVRKDIFTELLSEPSSYLNYYVELDQKYICSKNIYEEFTTTLRNNVLRKNDETHYRFFVYMQINPTLDQSPFMMMPGNLPLACTKFRLGSHKLPIEIGRWYRKKREERICPQCMVLGDEKHYLFECPTIDRDGLDIGNNMEHI